MGQIVPAFESQPITLMDAVAVTAAAKSSSIMKVGAPSDENSIPHAGVMFEVAVTPSGGSTNSALVIDVHRCFDGTNVDDEVAFTPIGTAITKTLLAADIGASGTYRASFVLRADVDIGYAFQATVSRSGGDRTLTVTIRARRWHWQDKSG